MAESAGSVHVALVSMLKGATELFANVAICGVLEGLFPPFNPATNAWISLIEGTVEVALFVLVSGTIDNSLAALFSGYEYAALPYGALAMFWLLKNGIAKIDSFVSHISHRLNVRRASFMHPSDKELTEFLVRERCDPGNPKCADVAAQSLSNLSSA